MNNIFIPIKPLLFNINFNSSYSALFVHGENSGCKIVGGGGLIHYENISLFKHKTLFNRNP